jgi:hypothetical protein
MVLSCERPRVAVLHDAFGWPFVDTGSGREGGIEAGPVPASW